MPDAPTFVPLGLAGGQGKTTVALMLGRILATYGLNILFVDADPQASLTAFLGVEPSPDRPTLLELISRPPSKIPLHTAIYPVPQNSNLFLIPADDELEAANSYLASSGTSLTVLRDRLYQAGEAVDPGDRVASSFDLIIVDPPPERSHLALTSLGCGNLWAIPAEANVKGVQSLLRTLELIQSYQAKIPYGQLAGVIPFRAKWVGLSPTETTRESIKTMEQLAGIERMLPHLLESDVYKRAINDQVLPRDLGKPDLEYPLLALIDRLKPALGEKASLIESREVVAR